jgi:signal transduction histidine kinase
MTTWDGQGPVPEELRLKPPYDQIAALRSRVFVNVPLIVGGKAIGVLGADRKESRRPFDPTTIQLLQLFAAQAGLAIGNAQLYEELLAHQNRLQALMAGILSIKEEEAKRIAHGLHDEAGQLLASVHLALEEMAADLPSSARAHVQNIRNQLDRIEDQLRRLSHELRPTILDDLGLQPALDFLAQGASTRAGIPVTVEGSTDGRLSPVVETAIYRIVQEALANASKHAQATSIRIQLHREADTIRCTVQDDGVGFDVAAVFARRGKPGLGLLGIRERLYALGGKLSIKSAPGWGTELLITIPIKTRDGD